MEPFIFVESDGCAPADLFGTRTPPLCPLNQLTKYASGALQRQQVRIHCIQLRLRRSACAHKFSHQKVKRSCNFCGFICGFLLISRCRYLFVVVVAVSFFGALLLYALVLLCGSSGGHRYPFQPRVHQMSVFNINARLTDTHHTVEWLQCHLSVLG